MDGEGSVLSSEVAASLLSLEVIENSIADSKFGNYVLKEMNFCDRNLN